MIDATALAGEALLAVSGLHPEHPLTRREGAAAERLPRDWKEAVRSFLEREPLRFRLPPALDVDRETTRLQPMRAADAVALTGEIESPEVASAYLDALTRARSFLLERLPHYERDAMAGPEPVEPSQLELLGARALHALVAQPERILTELRAGTLGGELANAFRTVYPQLHAMLGVLIWRAVYLHKAADKSYFVPHRIESIVRVLVGRPEGLGLLRNAANPVGKTPEVKIDFMKQQTKAQQLASR